MRDVSHCLWTLVLWLVVFMVGLWWVVRPGGRAESAHRLRNLMVVGPFYVERCDQRFGASVENGDGGRSTFSLKK